MKAVQDYTSLTMGVLLTGFWMIMVSQISLIYLLLGAVFSALIVFFFNEHLLNKFARFPIIIKNLVRLVVYIARLIYEIIIANIQVAKIVLSVNMNLSPTFIRFKGKLQKDASKAILGNSITLTPGTLTVEIEDDEFIVHGLTKEHAENLLDWYMVDYLTEMEGEENRG